jgi:hypothetical protein
MESENLTTEHRKATASKKIRGMVKAATTKTNEGHSSKDLYSCEMPLELAAGSHSFGWTLISPSTGRAEDTALSKELDA